MARTLGRLRSDLEFMPSPVSDRPGLLIRDPFHYTDTTLIIPPLLVECLRLFDGQATDLDLHQFLVRMTGDVRAGEVGESLLRALSEAAFLEDDIFSVARQACHDAFKAASVRRAAHAGVSYPSEPDALRHLLDGYLDGGAPVDAGLGPLAGIAAPHASFDGAAECYRAAYGALTSEYRDRVFVILGTSHSGVPDLIGLTRKPFETPLGTATTEAVLVDRLAAMCGPGAEMEDYCHSTEHSIEFQVLFLQHLFGGGVRILPILVGAYARSLIAGNMPEDSPGVCRVFDALAALAESGRERLFWVLGVDLAHMGPRYGDEFTMEEGSDLSQQVETRDRTRLERIALGDAAGFWSQVRESRDDLKWCGASPLYAFLKAVPGVRAEVAAYQQWSIDEASLVTCAALHFHQAR